MCLFPCPTEVGFSVSNSLPLEVLTLFTSFRQDKAMYFLTVTSKPCLEALDTIKKKLIFRNQEKGGFSKGRVCRIQGHAQENKNYARILGQAVRLALRALQSREAYILAKPPSKILLSWFFCAGTTPILEKTLRECRAK